MVDTETYYSTERPRERPDLSDLSDVAVFGVTDCLCSVCRKYNNHGVQPSKSKYSDYNWIHPSTNKEPTQHMYFLCDDHVIAYHMKSRQWSKLYLLQFQKGS